MDIESVLIKHLTEAFPEIDVCGDVPIPRPETLITVERVGGRADNIVLDYPRVAVQCWAPTRADAAELAYQVDSALLDIDDVRIPDMERSELYNFPDEHGNPRYQIVVEVTAYRV